MRVMSAHLPAPLRVCALTNSTVFTVNDYPGHPGYVSPTTIGSSVVFSNLADATYTPLPISTPSESPKANKTRGDCDYYIEGADFQIDVSKTFYNSPCEAIAVGLGVDLNDFETWNPSLDVSQSTCKLDPDLSYCASWYQGQPQTTQIPDAVLPVRVCAPQGCPYVCSQG